jgi:hypothetical protein
MTVASRHARRSAGERVELGRYRVGGAERVLIGQRVHGVVRVSDVPASGRGRRYLVERELTSRAELDALVGDYLHESAELRDCPMRRSRLDELLEGLS